MDKVAFYGSIKTDDHEVMSELLRDWVKAREIHVRIRLLGVEISYEDEGIYLYCHESSPPGMERFFLLEGHMFGTLAETHARLRELSRACEGRGVACRLEYVQVNDDGDQVSEEFKV
jgi:hypothetical protein